jgi:hypothetical protein
MAQNAERLLLYRPNTYFYFISVCEEGNSLSSLLPRNDSVLSLTKLTKEQLDSGTKINDDKVVFVLKSTSDINYFSLAALEITLKHYVLDKIILTQKSGTNNVSIL